MDHDTREQIGVVEDLGVHSDKVLRGLVRFSASAKAQEIRQDFLDGIRQNISVGYRVNEMVINEKDERYTAINWTPMEVSSVAIPADISVGAGRADASADRPVVIHLARGAEERTMADESVTKEPQHKAGPDALTLAEVRETVQKDLRDVIATCRTHKVSDERREHFLANGYSPAHVRDEIMAEYAKGAAPVVQKPAIELSAKEEKQYSMRSLVDAIDRGVTSFETEISDELGKRFPTGVKRNGGVLVPTIRNKAALDAFNRDQGNLLTRAGLDSGTATKGAEAKFTVPGDFLPILRNRMVVADAGCTFMAGLTGPVAFVNQNGAGTAAWVAENPGADVADSNILLQQITLAPKTLTSSTSYSRQLLSQSSYDIDGIVRTDLAQIMAVELDRAAINGSGASNQPFGVLNTTGVDKTTVAGGTNGAQPTFGNLVDLESIITAGNADILGTLAYITTPQIRGRLKQTAPLSNTVGAGIWLNPSMSGLGAQMQGGGSRQAGEVNGYLALTSQNVPSTLTKGASGAVCHAIIIGAFSQVVIGDWGMYELVVDPYRLKKQGMIELTVFAMFGIAVKYPAAFAAMVDALK